MPAIIYQKTPGGLFATGERTVSTFPSGLVRVDQTFICPTSDAATHRAALAVGNDMPGASAPAISGLKIFPEPQERQRGDGFTEFIVSAYGNTNTTGIITKSKKIGTILGLRYSSDSILVNHTFTGEAPPVYPDFISNTNFVESLAMDSVEIQRHINMRIRVSTGEYTSLVFTSPLLFTVYKDSYWYTLSGSLYSEIQSYEERSYGEIKEATAKFEANDLELVHSSVLEPQVLSPGAEFL
jgi:hypothetical protein